MNEQVIAGIHGNIKYDPSLVDYKSDAFWQGHTEGFKSITDIPMHSRPDNITDIEWASYCEGFLMGWCEK